MPISPAAHIAAARRAVDRESLYQRACSSESRRIIERSRRRKAEEDAEAQAAAAREAEEWAEDLREAVQELQSRAERERERVASAAELALKAGATQMQDTQASLEEFAKRHSALAITLQMWDLLALFT